MSETRREMDRARLVRDLVAVALGLAGFGVAIWSVVLGGWPVAMVWLALGLMCTAGVLAQRQEALPGIPDGLAAPDDANAMHVERARTPDTT